MFISVLRWRPNQLLCENIACASAAPRKGLAQNKKKRIQGMWEDDAVGDRIANEDEINAKILQ